MGREVVFASILPNYIEILIEREKNYSKTSSSIRFLENGSLSTEYIFLNFIPHNNVLA